MARSEYTAGKRAREADKARKRQEKEERKRRNRESKPGGGIPVGSVDDIQAAAMRESDTPPQFDENGVERPPAPRVERAGPAARLFVGGLSWDTDDGQLRTAFAAHGDVVEAVVVLDRDTGRSRGFGFVTMATRQGADDAITGLDGQDLDGRRIRVSRATDRKGR